MRGGRGSRFGGALGRWGPPIAYAALLLGASSQPTAGGPDAYGLDKAIHAAAYGVLGLLSRRAMGATLAPPLVVVTIAIGITVGVADEWIQSHVPGRNASGWDLLADAIGVASGVILGKSFWSHRWIRRFAI